MCFDADSRPPIKPIAGAAVDGQRIELVSEDGAPFMAFEARAGTPSGAGMLVMPDVRGLHRYYEELALRFAETGIDAVAIDWFGRTAGVADRGEGFDFMAHVAQTNYQTLLYDIAAGLHRLRGGAAADRQSRALFTTGFCFAGRLSFLAASRPSFNLAGVIGFYGSPVGQGRGGSPQPVDVAGEMRCPVLGLFGGSDPGIPAEAVRSFDMALDAAGVEHEIVSYPDAPHSFFDRKAEQFADESADAWQHVLDFVKDHTPG